jgi:hypothetical protein
MCNISGAFGGFTLIILKTERYTCGKNVPGIKKTRLNSVALVRERTIPTERPPLVGEVSANFCG